MSKDHLLCAHEVVGAGLAVLENEVAKIVSVYHLDSRAHAKQHEQVYAGVVYLFATWRGIVAELQERFGVAQIRRVLTHFRCGEDGIQEDMRWLIES